MSLVVRAEQQVEEAAYFSYDQKKVIKETLCPGISDQELELFAHVCSKSKLDPFLKQIYAIMRKNKQPDGTYKSKMTIQTAVDGLRLIADRTGKYVPGREPTYQYDKNGNLYQATSYIKKQTADGSWHEVAASALLCEYKPSQGQFWDRMPHLMLAKVAEALALRKAFPAEMCGLYIQEEMEQADVKQLYNAPPKSHVKCITHEQADEIYNLTRLAGKEIAEKCWANVLKVMPNADDWCAITPEIFDRSKDYLIRSIEKAKQKEKLQVEYKPQSMDEVAQEKSVFEEAE